MAKSLTKEENILLTLINAFQNDEKEKLNHLGNISKSLIEVRKKIKEEMEKLPPQFNILNLIRRKNSEGRLLTYETYNSNLLYQLLNIKKKNINFVKLFLEFMNGKFENNIDLNNIIWENVEAKNEYKNIDLLIRYKKYFAVIIENKIGYHDRDRQLEKYYNTMLEEGYGNNIYIIYLTPYGDNPSENSLPEEYYKKENGKLYGKFANIKHAEIGYWLEGILKRQEFSFLNNEEENNKYNYKLLKSALIQIIDNEKSISGENEEGDMTKDEIKELLEKNLFKEIKTIEKADEYIDMFNKANELLEEHRNLIVKKQISTFLNFTKEVAKKLEKQSYKKGDAPDKDTYCICDDNHVIEHGCHWLGLGELIFLQANYDNSMIYHFGVCVGKNDIKMKRKIKKLQETIKNIFDFEYHENSDEWILDYNQNIENENPKKIAEVMIKLYELLKKEIK